MLKEWVIPVGGAVVLVLVAVFALIGDFIKEPRIELAPQIQPSSSELLSRVVTSCAQLKQEINDMTQTTAELRKVIGDVAAMSCSTKWIPPPPPQCEEGKSAVLVDSGFGYPGWDCR